MSDTRESAIRLESSATPLCAMLYEPAGPPAGAVLLCDPIFEERKSAGRALVETARYLCARGFTVLRCDYRGCGDSAGEFGDFTVDDWLADVASAAACLRDRTGGAPCALLGLRFGATLALLAAARGLGAEAVVLWEPVLRGKEYVEQELRKKLMKEMVTTGGSTSRRGELLATLQADGGVVDFDGYALTTGLYRSLSTADLLQAGPGAPRAAFIVSINAQGANAPHALRLQSALAAAGTAVELSAVREQPFWNLIGYVDCTALIQLTADWLHRRLAAGAPPEH